MSWPYSGTARRPLVTGRQGLVSCAHSLAAAVGHEVLRSGGNAVDAAVAVSAALDVTEPFMSGLGGGGGSSSGGGQQGLIYLGGDSGPGHTHVRRRRRPAPEPRRPEPRVVERVITQPVIRRSPPIYTGYRPAPYGGYGGYGPRYGGYGGHHHHYGGYGGHHHHDDDHHGYAPYDHGHDYGYMGGLDHHHHGDDYGYGGYEEYGYGHGHGHVLRPAKA